MSHWYPNVDWRSAVNRVEHSAKRAIALTGISLATWGGFAPMLSLGEELGIGPDSAAEEVVEVSVLPVGDEGTSDASARLDISAEAQPSTEETTAPSPDALVEPDDEVTAEQFGAALTAVANGTEDAPPSRTSPSTDTIEAPSKAVRRNPAAQAALAKESILHQPAKFNGIQVGTSTREELMAAWGEPAEAIAAGQGEVMTYRIEPFKGIEVLVSSESVVTAIKISLAQELEPKQLAKQLALGEFESVDVTDEQGDPLGVAFPERGVVFMFGATAENLASVASAYNPVVSHVAIRELDSRAFALRAEKRSFGHYQKNIDDLKIALALDPTFAHAHWQLAEVYLATGQADLAEVESAEAIAIDPTNSAYHLRHAQALALLAEYDDAVLEIRDVLDSPHTPLVVKAQALHEMARLAALGDAQIASKAIGFEQKAIAIADELATSSNENERRAAKKLLVEAHLAIAEEVARQSFGKKLQSISQWIGRASGLAEDFIEDDGGSIELRLMVAQRSLAAISSFKPTIDPTPWVVEAEETAKELTAASDDELWHQHVKWELGIAYFNALRVEHLRRETNAALRYGQQAIEHLAEGASARQAVHSSEQLVGQLYFQVGAVYAVHKQDHHEAAEWYDKAAPLLTAPRPVSELYSPRREGEVLVSIGVTYWQANRQSRALELTRSGTDLVEMAVDDGILAKSSLAVPYGNMATMYQQLGETTSAAKFSELAKSVGGGANTARVAQARQTPGRNGQAVQTNAQLRNGTGTMRR